MTTTHRPGTHIATTITGQIQGGNLTTRLLITADGREYGLDLVDGITVHGDLAFGATVNVAITGTVVSAASDTVEVLYNRDWESVVRIPHALLEAA